MANLEATDLDPEAARAPRAMAMALGMADTDLMAMDTALAEMDTDLKPLLQNLARVPPEDTAVDTAPPIEATTAAVATEEA